MHRLTTRLRKLERQIPHLELSGFSADELVELTRLLIREQFGVEVTWAEACILTNRKSVQRKWCEFLRFSPPPRVIQDWFDIHVPALDRYHAPAGAGVTADTLEKLHAQFGLWDSFVKTPNWTWLFRHVEAVQFGRYLGP